MTDRILSHFRADASYLLANFINTRNASGDTALHWATKAGNTDVVAALLEDGADLNIKNVAGHDVRDVAKAAGRIAELERAIQLASEFAIIPCFQMLGY